MITATDLANYVRCPHRIYLDAHGDQGEAVPPTPEMQRLWDEGCEHEANVVATLPVCEARGRTPDARTADTRRLMVEGVPLIYHGLLQAGELVGEPDLLKRIDVPSTLGDFSYAPADIKAARATKTAESDVTKTEYAIQLCAYAELLERVQGTRPAVGWIVDRKAEWQRVELDPFLAFYQEIRAVFSRVREGIAPSEPGWSSAACPQCPWREHCWRVLRERDDLTTMSAIGIPKRAKLWSIGISTVSELADADPEQIAAAMGKTARLWPLRARAMKTGEPVHLQAWAAPQVEYEISYDVENTTEPFVYLHGLLLRKTEAPRFGDADFTEEHFGIFAPVCAQHPQSEEHVWRAFLAQLEDWTSRGTFVVYIYSPHEKGVLRRLRRVYGGSAALDRFEAAMVDLCRVVKRSVILPSDGDGLKAVASFVDFHWRDATPGGAQSITWWTEYWRDPAANGALRDRVLAYNEDDVRATFAIRDWLARTSAAAADTSRA